MNLCCLLSQAPLIQFLAFLGVTARCAFTPGYFLTAHVRGLKPNQFREKIWVMTRSLISLPPNARKFVSLRKPVAHLAVKSFAERVSQPSRQMIRRSRNDQLSVRFGLPFHDSRQRVVFGGAFGFVFQQPFDLVPMRRKKFALQVNVTARHAVALSFARWTNDFVGCSEMFVLLALPFGIRF